MAKEICGIDLSNGNLVIKYGDDYVHCYEGWLGCLSQILYDIVTYYAEDGDTSDWDGNEIELADIFENWPPKQILIGDEVLSHIIDYQDCMNSDGMNRDFCGIELSNGDLVIRYGGDYVHCYHAWKMDLKPILIDILSYTIEGDTSDWDGNEIELLDEFDNCKPKDLLDSDELIYLLVRRHYRQL